MNGASIVTPCSRSSACSASRRAATASSRLVREQPGDRQRQLAARPRRRARRPARRPAPARAPRTAPCPRRTRRRPRGCARRGRRSRRTRPPAARTRAPARDRRAPSRGGARSTAIFARSRSGSATTWPSTTDGASTPAPVISCPGWISITRTRAGAWPAIANDDAATGASASCRAARPAPARRRTHGSAPSLSTSDARNVRRGRRAARGRRRSRARSPRGRAARAPARRAAWPSPARPRARRPRRRRSGTSGRCGPRATGSPARGRRCRTRTTPGRSSRTIASSARRLRALDASRISTHMPRRRFSSASSAVTASWSERDPRRRVGVQRARPARPARARPRAARPSARARPDRPR